MAKSHTVFVCSKCGTQTPRWQGKCHECGAWGTLLEEAVPERKLGGMSLNVGTASELISLSEVGNVQEPRFSTGVADLDRVLGGGLVKGSLVLLGGPPGIGKSTLLLQAASYVAQQGDEVLYISGEESPRQIRMRAERLGVMKQSGSCSRITLWSETALENIENQLRGSQAKLVIVDSIQTIYRADLSPAPGSVTQVRECAAALMRLAKGCGITILLVGHITKGGDIAGPRVLEHLVDTVLHFDSHGMHNVRVLRTLKNRFGNTNEVGFLAMDSEGLHPIPNASAFFLSQRALGAPGTVVFPSMEGSRPVLVEIQVLVSDSYAAEQGVPPVRRSVGLDANKLSLLLAVIQKRCHNYSLGKSDVYANVAGGVRLLEPALDLPLSLALVSGRLGIEVSSELVAFGEVGLGGEIRAVSGCEARLIEAAKLGFKKAVMPLRSIDDSLRRTLKNNALNIELVGVQTLAEALRYCGLGSVKRGGSSGKPSAGADPFAEYQ
ncbi:DNA repair protein RadA [bacterium]|nr:DNA repair protein RadA [bacterium]